MNAITGMNLQIPTQSLMAALSNLQSISMKSTMQNQDMARKLLFLSIAIKIQAPQLGTYINIYG